MNPQVALTPLQIELVRVTWQRVQPMRAAAADLFYTRLFAIAPEVRPMFKREIQAQGAMLMATLDTVVASLDRLDDVLPTAERLARRHVAYGVQAHHYDAVGAALLWTLQQGLGDALTPAAQRAWQAAYGALAGAMQHAAYAGSEPAPAPTPRCTTAAAAAALVIGGALAPLSAEAAAYIKFDGIEGSTTAAPLIVPFDRSAWLQVSAGGRFEPRAGRPMESISYGFTAVTFNRAQTVSFVFTDGDTSAVPYFEIELQDVLVTSYDISAQGGGPRTLVFDGYSGARVSWLAPATANDPAPATLTAHWDTTNGSFSDALEALGGFDTIGAVTQPDGTVSFTGAVPEPGTWGLGLAGLSTVIAVVRRRNAAAATR